MKKRLVITLLAVAAFAAGCNPSTESNVQTAADKVETKTKETAQAAKELTAAKKEYAYAQRSEYVTEKQTQLAGINRDLDALSTRVDSASDATKSDAKPKLQGLRDQAAKLNKQLDEAKGATESTWATVKAGSSKAYEDLKDAFLHARQWVSDKIAP